MRQRPRLLLVSALALATLSVPLGPAVPPGSAEVTTTATAAPRLLGVTTIASGLRYAGTTVGGLSGIDRDPRTGAYYLISDDRSEVGPARFYSATIDLSAGAPDVRLTGASVLLRDDGAAYPSLSAWTASGCQQGAPVCDRRATVDPEDVRVDPRSGDLWWSQEGDRQTGTPRFLSDPSIRRALPDGTFAGQLRLPEALHVAAGPYGPRANLGLEAFTFADCGREVTSVLEGPLLQDGPEPTATNGALVRLSVQNRGGALQAQYAYPLDPVGGAPGANGVAAVLADPARPGRYLVLERTVVVGQGTRIRIYGVDLPAPGSAGSGAATDVAGVESLASGLPVRPLSKELLLDLADLGVQPGIVEGITWGPALPTGERSLVMVADDNFAARAIPGVAQVSQVHRRRRRRGSGGRAGRVLSGLRRSARGWLTLRAG
ncbi:esterase-like activity of phytase family protein [Nocardioides kongjuensis]|uniref:3-phytase n=1 Tax=Nocardioides kongjuensis TaxID=349522 RepID=A0A852RD92_9ACTN|nr:esterase-like activity of phytase family protein [Nocardioides kongjuensis]NYD32983.1 3-phytase [Nocardioides kongjuensis]